MSKARDLADLGAVTSRLDTVGASEGALSNRNLVINGAMQVAQRGTSFTPSGVTYCLDRFAHYASSVPSNAVQQSTDVPSNEGFQYSVRMDTVDLRHAVELPSNGEAGIFYNGQKLTLSFWAKTGSSTKSTTINLHFIDGAAFGNVSSAFSSSNNSIVITDSWQRFSIQYTVDTTPTASHYACGFSISGSANILYITGIQLELGTEATPFEHRSYGDELRRCQRYFHQTQQYAATLGGAISHTEILYHSYAKGASQWEHLTTTFPVTMRAAPTMTTSDASGNTGKITHSTSVGGAFTTNHDPYTTYATRDGFKVSDYNTGSIYGFSYDYKADAEL